MAHRLPPAEKLRRARYLSLCVREGGELTTCAGMCGLSIAGFSDFVKRTLGLQYALWPPSIADVDAAVASIEAQIKAEAASEGCGNDDWHRLPPPADRRCDPKLTDSQIAARRDQAENARAAHEQKWLAQEARPLGSAPARRPLSDQIL